MNAYIGTEKIGKIVNSELILEETSHTILEATVLNSRRKPIGKIVDGNFSMIGKPKAKKAKKKKKPTITIKLDSGFEAVCGNGKLPITTLIYNMGSASHCPSDIKGLCPFGSINGNGKLKSKCYAFKAERMYKAVLPYRTRQEAHWLNSSITQLIEDIKESLEYTDYMIKAIRFNESGDMHSIECLNKLKAIAKAFPELRIYTYTHRSDIMKNITIDMLPENLCINLSYSNNKEGFNSFILADKIKNNVPSIECIADCRKCNLCSFSTGINIAVKIH
jgi:hypothetical protein|tara:strand:- start:11764 stop:12594 length:831 start_codon:yes stop_codon:yes gene_type:complete